MVKNVFLAFAMALIAGIAVGQSNGQYHPHDAFEPDTYPASVNEFRMGNGAPGPKYFTNNAHYQIEASLDTAKDIVSGTVLITYVNNSPTDLHFLWLQLDQNLFTQSSRGQAKMPATGRSRYGDVNSDFDGGFKFGSIAIIDADGKQAAARKSDTLITDTRMQVRLENPLKANGGKVQLKMNYRFQVPQYGSDRTGIMATPHGKIYAIAQWYPRMSVYDDVIGWNTLPYLGASEFYLDYGDFDYKITAPANMIVAGSGALSNAKEVLSSVEYQRYQQAQNSDKTVVIRTADEIKKGTYKQSGSKTWHFRLKNARDIAWAASASFVWDAARMNLQDGEKALAQSVYPMESISNNGWERSTEYVKAAIEGYSRRWYHYPYPSAVNVAANINGMEYPAIVFCNAKSLGQRLWGVTDHEFGHTWFPMIVGSNERRYGWMDEGLNMFINDISTKDFNHGEYAPRISGNPNLPGSLFNPNSETVMSRPDALKEANIGAALYYKPGYALGLLREHILGKERFDYAFRTYIDRWAYKHPMPNDFFRTMENASGEDLQWFWKGMFINNWKLDQAIIRVTYVDNDPANGALVYIGNMDKMIMPVYLQYTTVSGKTDMDKIPVEVWQNGNVWIQKLKTTEKLKSVEIDPEHVFPDIDAGNNKWTEN